MPRMKYGLTLLAITFCLSALGDEMSHAQHQAGDSGPGQCGGMMGWDPTMQMCQPLAMAGMSSRMLMVQGNVFAGYDATFGPRGRDAWFVNDMIMVDGGTSLGDTHYLALDVMLTSEKWTVPRAGYPLLLQIGEEDADGKSFLDAQHPHSSPIMGVTLSDTVRIAAGDRYFKLFFAPRGESTDGPIAFMHRPSARMNPDAPLGHHIGQDVGHITSTVLGGALQWDRTRFELSTFNGAEPSPTKVDLPLGTPDSLAGRVTEQWTSRLSTMVSLAYVRHPEPDAPEIDHVWRYSASAYLHTPVAGDLALENSLIYGGISPFDANTGALNSFSEEFRLHADRCHLWGRIEVLQRTPRMLAVTATAPDDAVWLTSVTLGYSHVVARFDGFDVALSASLTHDLLPAVLSATYGGDPWAAKAFLYVGGMNMWEL